VKVAAGRFGEDRFQNALVLVTHRCTGGSRIKNRIWGQFTEKLGENRRSRPMANDPFGSSVDSLPQIKRRTASAGSRSSN
jgi:hypothetical protein